MADTQGKPAPLPRAGKLNAREIERRITAMNKAATAIGITPGAIRMSAAGDIELVDRSLIDANTRASDVTDGFL